MPWVQMVRARAPFDRTYRHGLMEGFQVHRLWYVTRLWPGVPHRPDDWIPVPWTHIVGCFLWTGGHRLRHRGSLLAGCLLAIGPQTVEAYWFTSGPETRAGTLRWPRTSRWVPLRLEWIEHEAP
ncbi:MAG: hypothetical protein NZ742_00225 [Acidobacteria bacterium]|nr:hypothetical protein [Acidobacteriota bacterium]MDW7983178.1 hypothetical protein [Acidobacteriota bacterium]